MKKSVISLLVLLVVVLLSSCQKTEVIKIGFAGTLSGTYASVGVAEMYGVQLAVKEINENGGINNKQIELLIRDDKADPDEAVRVDNELYDLGVRIIIGHSLSIVSLAIVENANEKGILLLSPSIGTEELTGIDDMFIRNVATVYTEAEYITKEMISDNPGKMLMVYNLENYILTQHHFLAFNDVVTSESFPDNNVTRLSFHSENQTERGAIQDELLSNEYDSVFFATSNLDAAPFVNYIKSNDIDIDIHLSSWAATSIISLIDSTDTEDIYSYINFDLNNQDSDYLLFKSSYEEEYGVDVDMLCINAYDLMYVIKDAVESGNSEDVNKVKSEILDLGSYKGINGVFTFNEFGDTIRTHNKQIIIDGKFEIIEAD